MALTRKIATFMLAVAANLAYSQKEAENWYFASQCGLHFRAGDAGPLTDGALKAIEGSSVISHKHTGELLFYTDGRNFWTRNHEQMRHVYALPGNCYTRISQPAIIIPSPEDESVCHVICIRAEYELEHLGQMIWSPLSFSAVKNEIDLTGLSDGLYLLRFTRPRGKINFRKLLKVSEYL